MHTSPTAALPLLLAFALHAAPAQGELARTFVSAATGNDANDCDRPTPCRTLQAAHDKTSDRGEIAVLDPGGYGAVNVTKSVSIVNDAAGEASILVAGGAPGLVINSGAESHVMLRGLTVQGTGLGDGAGLVFNSGFALSIADCAFHHHARDGISFAPNAGGIYDLSIAHTLLADNGNMGILIGGASAPTTIRAVLDHVEMLNNRADGMFVDGSYGPGTISVSAADSIAAGNGRDGFDVFTTIQAATSLTLLRSVAANNLGFGVDVEDSPKASLRFEHSTITGNGHSWVASGGAFLQSIGDNSIAGNGDGDPAPPMIARR